MSNKLTEISNALLTNQTDSAKYFMARELGIKSQVERNESMQTLVTAFVTCHINETDEVIKANKDQLYALPKMIQAKLNKGVDSLIEKVDGKIKTVWKPKKGQKHMSEDVLKKLKDNMRQCYRRVLKDLGLVTADKRGGQKKRIEAAKLESKEAWQTVDGVRETIARLSAMVKTQKFLAIGNKAAQGSMLAMLAHMTANAELFAVEKPASEVSKTAKKGNRTKHTIGK